MHFQVAENLMCTISPVNRVHVFICTLRRHNVHISLLLSTTITHLSATLHLLIKSVKVLHVSVCASSFVDLSAFVSLTFHLH